MLNMNGALHPMKITSNAVPIPTDRERECQLPSRRRFLTGASALGLASLALRAPVWGAGHIYENAITYHLPDKVEAMAQSLPSGKRQPFGWKFCYVPKSNSRGTVLTWPGSTALTGPSRFRIATALDTRDEKRVEAYLPGNGRVIGVLDLRFAPVNQPHEIELSAGDTREVLEQGLGLRVREGSGSFIFDPDSATAPWDNHAQLPHLIEDRAAEPLGEFYARMASHSVLQQFGWNQQCVWDGLLDLDGGFQDRGFRDAWEAQLGMYVDKEGKARIESPRSDIVNGTRWGVENSGCAVFYELHTEKWAIAEQGLQSTLKAANDNNTTEGCYTVGYPLCLWGEMRGDEKLKDKGVENLMRRKENLRRTPDTIHQRTGSYDNWARGVAWYFLGFARSLDYLKGHPQYQAVVDEVAACVHHVRQYQRSDGLWEVFMHEDGLGRDTSGSAGVAAACAMAARHGIETKTATGIATAAWKGLQAHLRPDGLLSGVAQSNRGGGPLQRNGYRVIYPMAMGLMAQLAGSLAKIGMPPRAAAR
jgi:unsaturated rhamnogalacturonyl hydrolase